MASLKDICYENIKDNYWYGLFGDFKLIIDKDTGCFNATKLCKQGGKRFKKWIENKQSKELIEYYNEKSDGPNSGHHFINIKKGNKDEKYNKIISGTYVRKELILSIAIWISNDFYDKVYKIIESYYIKEFEQKYKNDKEKINKKLAKIERRMIKLKSENEKFKEVKEDIAPKTINEGKLHLFALIQKNKSTSKHPFYAMRAQRLSYKKHLNRLRERYPNLSVIFELKYDPNSINLLNRIREQFEDVDVRFNGINLLNDYTIENFIKDIKILSKQKF